MIFDGSIAGCKAGVVVTERVIMFMSNETDGVLNGDCLLNESGGGVSSIV